MSVAKNTLEAMRQEKAKLEAEIAQLRQEQKQEFSIKASVKGCVSVYGLGGRFPTSLYPEQWETLLSHADDVRGFISANKASLTYRKKA